MFKLRNHEGVVLEPSTRGFDGGASTWGCTIKDSDDGHYYLYYTGWTDTSWSEASIGVARSSDGISFAKHSDNPILSVGKKSVTPAVFKAQGRYWMVFAAGMTHINRLGVAVAEAPLGPWKFVKYMIKAEEPWEGGTIDIGPSVVRLGNDEHLVFYSNESERQGRLFRLLLGSPPPSHLRRRIGVLRVRVPESGDVRAERWVKNPLAHLNGERGSWRESVFCPGYLELSGRHYLFPASSTYSVGDPYKTTPQYIGVIEDSSPLFQNPITIRMVIDGPREKNQILPRVQGEIALDTPCPLMRGQEMLLYYSAMDRADCTWKTVLSVFSKQ